jgi:DNA-binding transcriptional LysR family regulator
MELRDIEYFAVIAEHGNVRRAADTLEMSPPALSKSLRRLEKAMQAKLVKRSTKGVELTVVGSALLAQVRRIRLTLDDVAREAADLSQGRAGHLRIGAGPTTAEYLLPTAYCALMEEAPNVTMEITVSDQDVMLPMLRNGSLDLIANHLGPAETDLEQEFLCDNAFVAFASAVHPLAKKKQVTLADLAQERWAMNSPSLASQAWLFRTLEASGLPRPRIVLMSRYHPLRFGIIASSRLLGFTSRRSVRQAARTYPLAEIRAHGFPWIRRDGVIYRKDAYLSPAAQRFIEILKSTAQNVTRKKQ